MISKIFTKTQTEDFTHEFFKDISIYNSHDGQNILVECEFDSTVFSNKLFSLFSIDLPNNLNNAVESRKAEFFAGRVAAKYSINRFSSESKFKVAIGNNREPIWPNGLIGSITHSGPIAACTVGSQTNFEGLGIDIEKIFSLSLAKDLRVRILNNQELSILTNGGISIRNSVTLAFSAKEAFYKAVYPLVKSYLPFDSVKVIRVESTKATLILKVDPVLCKKHRLKSEYIVFYEFDHQYVKTFVS